ncbi:MAG TPA: hypothetical protein PK323_07315 [Bacteroidia bacterium]|nr:hypothetical protein [Bacteroidia bacterium]
MRVIGEIPHNEMKITLFYMNQKFLVKFELNGLEQIYKISEFDYIIKTVEEVKSAITQDFIHRVSLMFDEMQNNLSEALKDYC